MKVTFFNRLTGCKGLLLDDVTMDQAVAIKAKHSDKKQRYFYLPDVQIEPDDMGPRKQAAQPSDPDAVAYNQSRDDAALRQQMNRPQTMEGWIA